MQQQGISTYSHVKAVSTYRLSHPTVKDKILVFQSLKHFPRNLQYCNLGSTASDVIIACAWVVARAATAVGGVKEFLPPVSLVKKQCASNRELTQHIDLVPNLQNCQYMLRFVYWSGTVQLMR